MLFLEKRLNSLCDLQLIVFKLLIVKLLFLYFDKSVRSLLKSSTLNATLIINNI